jgi:hypothetical protein
MNAEVTLIKYAFESGLSHYAYCMQFDESRHQAAKEMQRAGAELFAAGRLSPSVLVFLRRLHYFALDLPQQIETSWRETEWPANENVDAVVKLVHAARECDMHVNWASYITDPAEEVEFKKALAAQRATEAAVKAGRAYDWKVVSSLAPLRYVGA